MRQMNYVIFAGILSTMCLAALAASPDQVAEAARLQDRMDEQSREIAIMTGYVARLKQILITAGVPSGPPAQEPARRQKNDGSVRVATAEQPASQVVTRAYDVSAMLRSNMTPQEAADSVIRIVMEAVAPDSWRDNGGSIGSLSFNGSEMVVTQTSDNLAAIEGLLDQLNADRAISHRRASIDQQELRIVTLTGAIDQLTARCRSAGLKVPPRVDSAMLLALPETEFIGTPLSECLKSLSIASGQIISVNGAALAAAGIDPHVPITLTLSGRTLAEALPILLDRADAGGRLQYRIKDYAISVSTRADFDPLVTRVYDARNLLLQAARSRQEAYDQLMQTITSTIEPDSWRDAGGVDGAIRELQGQLIVTQRETVHSRIKAYLELRRVQH